MKTIRLLNYLESFRKLLRRSCSDDGRVVIRSGGLSEFFRKAGFVMTVNVVSMNY